MNEFVRQDIETPIVILFVILSMVLAIFQMKIFETFYDLKLENWLFFVVNPALIGIVTLIDKHFSFLAFLLLFLSVFLVAIIGMIYSLVKTFKKGIAEKDEFNKKHHKKPLAWWQKVLIILAGLLFIISFIFFGIEAMLLLFLIIPYVRWVIPGNESRFFKLQNSLPTSKIRSLAMGLAEIEGKLEMIKPIKSPIGKKECIGFQHKIARINRRRGKETYSTTFSEIVCNPFYIVDDTGKIEVNPEKLEFVWVKEDRQYRRDGELHTEYLLKPNDKMLIIGKACLKENNQPVFEYENIKKVFAILPSVSITNYNTYKPLLNSFIGFSCVFAFIAAIILITPMKITDNKIIIEKPKFESKFLTTDKDDEDNIPSDSTKHIENQ
jgi:hypothetical protein